ncbi:MAG: hypothetical protein WD512_04355, partial [Candidatus Paceibacterota bacterium]
MTKTDKIYSDGELLFDLSLIDNPEAHDVIVDGLEAKVIIHSKSSGQTLYDDLRYMLFKGNNINKGTVVEFDGKSWIVIRISEWNGIYSKTEIRMSNYNIVIAGTVEQTYVGDDWRGEPIYEETVTESINIPVVTETNLRLADSDQ